MSGESVDVVARTYHTVDGVPHAEDDTYAVTTRALAETLRGIGFVSIAGWTEGPIVPPTITALTPATVALGAPDFTVSVTGTGFSADSVIVWNDLDEPRPSADRADDWREHGRVARAGDRARPSARRWPAVGSGVVHVHRGGGLMATVRLQVFGRALELTAKAAPLTAPNGMDSTRGGWFPLVVREPYAGAWQVNVEGRRDLVLAYSAVYACVTLIASDIGSFCLQLVERTRDDIWEPATFAYLAELRSRTATRRSTSFVEQWITSKPIWGNTHAEGRDGRGVVTALSCSTRRVKPLVAPDGGIYYELRRDDLSGELAGLSRDSPSCRRAIIHDTMISPVPSARRRLADLRLRPAAMAGPGDSKQLDPVFTNGSWPERLAHGAGRHDARATRPGQDRLETQRAGEWRGRSPSSRPTSAYALTMNAVDAQAD